VDIKKLIDISVWPPKITVIVNLFGEIHLPDAEPTPTSD
jgi:hypothetical protein